MRILGRYQLTIAYIIGSQHRCSPHNYFEAHGIGQAAVTYLLLCTFMEVITGTVDPGRGKVSALDRWPSKSNRPALTPPSPPMA